MRSPLPAVLLAFWPSVVATSTGLAAQDTLRAWGWFRFDTEAFLAPAADVVCAGSLGNDISVVTRVDGRVFIQGYSQLGTAPPAGAGTHYLRVVVMPGNGQGVGLLSNGILVAFGTGAVLPPPPAPGTAFGDVSVGYQHAVALRSDGVAIAWGSNTWGQTSLPVIPAGVQVRVAAATAQGSLLLLSNGQVVACGQGLVVTAIPALPAGLTYKQLWCGTTFAVARRSDGSLVAWGVNDAGQCNLPALPPGITFRMAGLGGVHGMAVCSDGALVGWGDNFRGQATPPALPAGAVIAQIACGGYLTLIRLSDGSVVQAGEQSFAGVQPGLQTGERWAQVGPLAATTTSGRLIMFGSYSGLAPTPPPGVGYVDVKQGYIHTAALRSDGRVVAWGYNGHGQCAIPSLPAGLTYTVVRAGVFHTVLLRSDGAVVQCGASGNPPAVPALPPGVWHEQVDADYGNILLGSDGVIRVAPVGSSPTGPPPTLPAGLRWESVAMARTFCAALRSDGQVVTWGSIASPPPPPPTGVVYVQIEAANDRMVLRRSDGQLAVGSLGSSDPINSLPELRQGESFMDIDVRNDGLARVGPTSTYVTYANGCAGTRPASRLVPRETPRIGTTQRVTIFDLPQDLAAMAFGWNTLPGVPLAGFGMPGCAAHVAIDVLVAVPGSAGQARLEFSIPDSLALVGASFVNQAIVFDTGANPAGLVVSDAARAVIGRP